MRAQVMKAIKREGPDYVPLFIWNRDWDTSDIVFAEIQKHFQGDNRDYSEWGFQWIRKDETMGHPSKPVLSKWEDLTDFRSPSIELPGRFDDLIKVKEDYPDKFIMASLSLSGFTTMTCIAGFEAVLSALYEARSSLNALADLVFQYENALICQASRYQPDAILFLDDWGMEQGLIISPELWRTVFKPRYREQFDLVHQQGMLVYFHSCGFFYDILPDLLEIGVDVMNISQPNLYDIPTLGKDFGGTTCFCCPVSYQTTSITGTPQDIQEYINHLFEYLGGYHGGLIGYAEEYQSIGLSEENYQACVQGFKQLKYAKW